MANKSLQAIGNDALQNAPKPLQRVLHSLNMQFQPESGAVSPLAGGLGPGADGMIAGVSKGSPNTISVMKPDVFTQNADQLATHEGMHVWQNNLPPSLQAKIPADNPNDPNNYGGTARIADLVKHGGTVLDLPREQSAAAMQYGQVHGMPEPYKSLANTMNAIPQSTVDMTDPDAKEINTHPRAPLPPIMNYATDTYKKGQPAPGDDPYASYAQGAPAAASNSTQNDPYASYANQSASPEQPEDDRNAFQRRVDDAVNTPSATGPRWLDQFGRGAAGSIMSPLAHPIEAAKGLAQSAQPDPGAAGLAEGLIGGPAGPLAVNTLRGLYGDYKQNGLSHVLGSVAGMVAGGKALDAPFNEAAGDALKSSGGKMIESTVGLRKADVARGARPGMAYLEGGGGPALSMRGIANQSSDIASRTGGELSQKYNAATESGTTIPSDRLSDVLNSPIARAEAIRTGPGGTGGTSAFQEYRDSLSPLLSKPSLTPNDVFAAKRNIAANTRWNDPTQFDLNKVRQMNVGGLGGELTDAVPGTGRLNKIYQGTTNLANRAEQRASTGQAPLTQIGRRSLEGIVGAGAGMASGHPLAGLIPLAVDSVPVRTSIAKGLFVGGNALPGLLPSLSPLAGASVAGGPKKRPQGDSDN